MKKRLKKLVSILLVILLVATVFMPAAASSGIMTGVSTWRYQYGIVQGDPSVNNNKVKVDFDTNGMLEGLYADHTGQSDFSSGKIVNDFNIQIVEGVDTYNSDNVSIVSEDGTALNGYDKNYDFFKRRMSEFTFNGTNSNRYDMTMYSEFLKSSDIVYLYPRLHLKESANPSNVKYQFKFPALKYDKIYYDVEPEQILQEDSYVNQGQSVTFKGDNLLNASGGFEKVGGWSIEYTEVDLDTVCHPRYEVTDGFPGWKIYGNAATQQEPGGKYGNYSMKLTNNETDYSGYARSKFDVQRGDTYTISAWVKAYDVATSAKLWIDGYAVEDVKQVTSGAWTQLTATLNIPVNPDQGYDIITVHPSICISSAPGTSILVDGVKVELGSTPTEYGNNLTGLSTSTVLYDSVNQEGIVIYTPQDYPEKRRWYTDDFLRKAFFDYSIIPSTDGNDMVLTYDVSSQLMDSNETIDFYFYIRPFKGNIVNDGISAFRHNLNTIENFRENYINVTTLNKEKSYYPIEGYADQYYHYGFTSLHKGKSAGYPPMNDVTSQQDWGVNGEKGFNWGFITHALSDLGKVLYKNYRREIDPSQALKDELRRYCINYIDKCNDSKWNGEYVSGGAPNYKLMHDSYIPEFTRSGKLDEAYNNFFFAQVMANGAALINSIIGEDDLTLADRQSIFNNLEGMKNIFDKDGVYTWTTDINHLEDGSMETLSEITSGDWTAVGNMSITNGTYTLAENNGTDVESNYASSSFSSEIGTSYASKVDVKSNLSSGAKVWVTTSENPELIDSTPINDGFNGGLEEGTLNNWVLYNSESGDTITLETSEKYEGTYSLKLTHGSTNTNTVLRNTTSKSSITGKKYKASAWVKSADGSTVDVTINIADAKPKTYKVGNVWTKIETIAYVTNTMFNSVGIKIPSSKAIFVDGAVLEETGETYVLNDHCNYGMELGNTNDWGIVNQGSGDTIQAVSDIRYSGDYALKYTHGSSDSSTYATHYAYVPSISGRKYKASAWVRSESTTPVDVTISISGVEPRTYSVGPEWTNISTVANATTAYFNMIRIQIPSSVSIYIDNAKLEDTYESIPLNQNCNGGLEDGTVNLWEINDTVNSDTREIVTDVVHSGDYAIKYKRATNGKTTFIRNKALQSSTVGKRYKATAWVRASYLYPVDVTIDVSGVGKRTYTVSGEWTQISTVVNATNENFNTVSFTIPLGEVVYIDDCVLMEVTDNEPVYSINIGDSQWTTIKDIRTANLDNSDLKLYCRPGDKVLIETKSVQKIAEWSTVGDAYAEISTDAFHGTKSLLFENNGDNSRDNYIETEYIAGAGEFDEGRTYIASVRAKAKPGTTARVWMDMSEIYSGKGFLNKFSNGDLEYADTSNWDITNKTANDSLQVYSTDKYEGTYALRYDCGSSSAALRYLVNETSKAGKSYKASAMVKALGTAPVSVSINIAGKKEKTYNVGTTYWKKIYTIVEAADKGINFANIKIPSGCSILVDDLKIEETTEKMPLNACFNPDLEEGNTNYWELVNGGSGDLCEISATEVYSGNYSIKYTHGSTNNAYIRNACTVDSIIGKKYKATAWVKSGDTGSVDVQMNVSGVGSRTFVVGSEWTQVYTYVTATNNLFNKVTLVIPQGKSIYIDDVTIVETEEQTPLTDSGGNSGLETGTTSNWEIVNAGVGDSRTVITGDTYSGTYALEYTFGSTNSTYVRFRSGDASIPGKQYRASVWVKNTNSETIPVTIDVSGVGKKKYLVDNTWKKITTYVDVTNQYFNTIAITIPSGNSIIIDDAELVETYENVPINFTKNWDIETGTTDDFMMYNFLDGDTIEAVSSEKHSGNYSLKFTSADVGPNDRRPQLRQLGGRKSTVGKKVRATAWVKSATVEPINVVIRISGQGNQQYTVGNQWTMIQSELISDGPNYNQVEIIIGKNRSIYIDDIVIEEYDGQEELEYYDINDSSWVLLSQPQNNSISTVQKLKIYTRPGDEILIDGAVVEVGHEPCDYYVQSPFYEYSTMHTEKRRCVANTNLEVILIASYMKKIAYAANRIDVVPYWDNIVKNGIDSMYWFVSRDNSYTLGDIIYRVGSDPNGDYGKVMLIMSDECFYEESYRKNEFKPYIKRIVENFMEDDKNDDYTPLSRNFMFEIAQVTYCLVWDDIDLLRTMASNWQVYYPTETNYMGDIRALRLYGGLTKSPVLGDKWYYGFEIDQPFTDTFGALQLMSDTYYIENSTDSPVTAVVTIKDRDPADGYTLSGLTGATELISDSTLPINNDTITITIPQRTFRVIKLNVN